MGFYGNITNTARSAFQFDRTYPNRAAIETNIYNDGVYVGRYILVEYDSRITNNDYKEVYRKNSDFTYLYASANCELSTKLRYLETSATTSDEILYGVMLGTFVIVDEATASDITADGGEYSFYYCYGQDDDGFAKFKQVDNLSNPIPNTLEAYVCNYNIDKQWAATKGINMGRGWDSTVWQKTYVNGVEKYVLIAELNTVVPTFDITADAPSVSPITPHFDERSTDVYYKLHWQPQWGVRIKSSDSTLKGPVLNSNGDSLHHQIGYEEYRDEANLSVDETNYPSDDLTSWYNYEYSTTLGEEIYNTYNPETSQWEKHDTLTAPTIPAAIYWNKDGFNPETIAYSSDLVDINPETNIYHQRFDETIAQHWENKDTIKLSPTGQSGHIYQKHTGDYTFGDQDVAVDTQELSIMLPSIGNTIAQMWDIVYGGRTTNSQINASNTRNLDINWENAKETVKRNGLRLLNDKYMPVTLDETVDVIGKYYIFDTSTGKYKLTEEAYNSETTYYVKNGGFTLDRNEVNTLAGCINSVHDLMGMIIVENNNDINPLEIETDDLDMDKIYYYSSDGSYRYKKPGYQYDEIKYKYIPAEVDASNYYPNIYYIKTLNADEQPIYTADRYVDYSDARLNLNTEYNKKKSILDIQLENEQLTQDEYDTQLVELNTWKANKLIEYTDIGSLNFDPTAEYYQKVSDETDEDMYEVAGVGSFKSGNYYKDSENCFIYDTSTSPQDGITYYKLESNINHITGYNLTTVYTPNYYYYKDTNDNYVRDNSENLILGRQYYEINTDQLEKADYELRYYNPEIEQEYIYYYSPGVFRYQEGEGDDISWVTENAEAPRDGVQYYLLDVSMERTGGIDDEGHQVYSYTVKETYPVTLKTLTDDVYYLAEADGTNPRRYLKLTQTKLNALQDKLGYRTEGPTVAPKLSIVELYHINPIQFGGLYEPGKYYYKSGRNLIFDNNEAPTEGKVYYLLHELLTNENANDFENYILFSKITESFYTPNKYYIWNPEYGTYVLSRTTDYDEEIEYYNRADFYVLSDIAGVYPRGSVWNKEIQTIPCTVTLALRKNIYKMETLTGFARNLNTIHGLILQINKLLAFNDYETRDRNTVQGTINALNDIINSFDNLLAQQFVIVDNYGRVKSSAWTSAQAFGYENFGTGNTDNQAAAENQWVHVHVNGDPINSLVTFEHGFTPVDDTNTISNKNILATENVGINNNTNDTLQLYTPIVDLTGHIVGHNNETVTLPYGYSKIICDNDNTIEATHVHDTLNIIGDSWLTTSVLNNQIEIKHTAPLPVDARELSNITPQFGDSFTIEDWRFDDNGHKYGVETHTITIPQGKLTNTEKTNGAASVLTNIEFVPTTGETIVKTESISTMKLDTYEAPTTGEKVNIAVNDTISTAFKKLDAHLDSTDSDIQNLSQSTNNSVDDINQSITTLNTNITNIENDIDNIEDKVNILESLKMPDYSDMTNNSVYMIKKTSEGLQWVELSSWTGGSY